MSKEQDAILTAINKRYKRPLLVRGGDLVDSSMLPFGVPNLDLELGGGLATGRLSLLVGGEGTAKTTLCGTLSAQALAAGMDVYFVDIERAVDSFWLKKGGLDVKHDNFLLVSGAEERGLVGEDVFRIVREILKAIVNPSLIIVDSLAAMLPEEDTQDKTTIAPGAKLVNRAIRVWNLLLPANSLLVMVNQYRSGPGTRAAILPHGMGQLFHSSQRLDLRRGSWLLERDEPAGIEIKFRVQKNKLSKPFGTGVLDLYFENETVFDTIKSLVIAAIKLGTLVQSGSWFEVNGQKIQGQRKLTELLRNDNAMLRALWLQTYKAMSPRTLLGTTNDSD
jgi:recombination protein RecA